jgi:type I restriction enzyme S subunit
VHVRDLYNTNRKQLMSNREQYKRAARGDIAYNMMRMWQGAVGVAPTDGLVSPAYVVASPFSEADGRYYSYLFRTAAYMNEVNKYSRGIVTDRNRLYWDEFKQMPSIYPPPGEQRKIADVLDSYDRTVRRFIRAKRRSIELLNEQKQSIIHRAVTRGLDPSVHLKPSGIDWLGDVPEHWEVRRVKQVCHFIYGDSLLDDKRLNGDTPVYGSNGQVGMHDVANTYGPCLVVGRKGSYGKVNLSMVPVFAIDTTFFVDDRFTDSDLRWLFYVLSWARLDVVTKDSAVPGLDRNEAYSQVVPYCPRLEQEQIAHRLDFQLGKIDLAIASENREIVLLREYRTRLIADVVTGKLDVRGVELPKTDETAVLEDFDDGEDVADMAEETDEIEATEEEDEG